MMQTGNIRRQFRTEPQDFSGSWVLNCEHIGMQGLSAKGPERGLRRLRQKRRFGAKSRPVNLVAHERMTDRSQVDPDLRGAPGFEPARQQARDRQTRTAAFRSARAALLRAIAFQPLPMGDGLPPALAYRHAVASDFVPVDRPVDRPSRPVRCAPNKSQIAALERSSIAPMACELLGQTFVSAVVLCDDHQTGRVLVEPMDNTGAPPAANPP